MKYTAILNGEERELEIIRRDAHSYVVSVEGQSHEVDARSCGVDLMSILIDDHSYDISYSFDGDMVHLNFWNQYFNIEVLDERKMRRRKVRSSLDMSGPEILKTSMPGKVVKVLVGEGDSVASGDGVIIIEAMKMENVIQCRNDGVVRKIAVKAGEAIEGGTVLVEIDPPR